MRFLSVCLVLALTSSSSAAIVTLSTGTSVLHGGTGRLANQGWWSDNSNNTADNNIVATGRFTLPPAVNQRSFFTFDLSDPGLTGTTINSATLQIQLGNVNGAEAIETLELFSVSTDASTLNATGSANIGIFTDLGTGTSFGSTDFNTTGASTDIIDFTLNADGIAAIQTALGGGGSPNYFSIGARLTSADGVDDLVFAGVDSASSLVIDATAVPEPGAVTLLAMASAIGAFVRRRRA